jgi:hypothetical protein
LQTFFHPIFRHFPLTVSRKAQVVSGTEQKLNPKAFLGSLLKYRKALGASRKELIKNQLLA